MEKQNPKQLCKQIKKIKNDYSHLLNVQKRGPFHNTKPQNKENKNHTCTQFSMKKMTSSSEIVGDAALPHGLIFSLSVKGPQSFVGITFQSFRVTKIRFFVFLF